MSKWWRRAGRGAAVALHLITGAVLVVLWLRPLARADGTRHARHRARLTHWWMQRLLAILGVRLEISGQPVPGPALIVANHISWLDIPCLLACLDARVVAKREVGHWPIIGLLARGTGTLFLERGASAGRVAAAMQQLLAAGGRLVLFPEGTSTDGRGLRPFHARLYEPAIRAGVPVQAVALRYPRGGGLHPHVPFVGDDRFVAHLWRLLEESEIVARLHFCPPLAASGAARRELADRNRQQIVAAFADSGTATLPDRGGSARVL